MCLASAAIGAAMGGGTKGALGSAALGGLGGLVANRLLNKGKKKPNTDTPTMPATAMGGG